MVDVQEWKIKATSLFELTGKDVVITVKTEGTQVRISVDGLKWEEMGAVKRPIGLAGQSSFKCEAPMEWDTERQEVVPGKN